MKSQALLHRRRNSQQKLSELKLLVIPSSEQDELGRHLTSAFLHSSSDLFCICIGRQRC